MGRLELQHHLGRALWLRLQMAGRVLWLVLQMAVRWLPL
jgi:hypothetical protein